MYIQFLKYAMKEVCILLLLNLCPVQDTEQSDVYQSINQSHVHNTLYIL